MTKFSASRALPILLILLLGNPLFSRYEQQVIEVGVPIESVVIADAAFTTGIEGEPLICVIVKGPPALFQVFDARTGVRLFDEALAHTKISWGMDTAPDGTVYISTNTRGRLLRWKPGSEKVEDLGVPLRGETHLWELQVASDGRVYSGTYPGGRAFEYNPETGKVRDFGPMAENAAYARGIAVNEEFLFVGTGAQRGQLFQIDRETGEKTEISLPPEATAVTMVGNLRWRDGRLYTSARTENGFLVYDPAGKKWTAERLSLPSAPGPQGDLYSLSGFLHKRDSEKGEWIRTDFRPSSGGGRSYGWLEIGEPEFPGLSLLSVNMRGRFWIYNPETGQNVIRTPDILSAAVPIRSSHTGPDGRVYLGGYLSPGAAAAYDPEKKSLTRLSGISQIEGWGTHGNEILIGVYPNAKIYRYDPARPWRFGENPKHLFDIADQQDRPFAFASSGTEFAIGTVPKAGQLGGSLTIADEATGEHRIHRNVVSDQSIISLTYHEPTGLFVGGSSISGGLGIKPVATEGKLFLWDPSTEKKIWSTTPVPGEMGVTGLTPDSEGRIWGVSGKYLFCFHPQTRTILKTVDLFPGQDLRDPGTEWVNGYLNFHTDGKLYGMARSRIFRFDPATEKVDELLRTASYFAQEPGGDILFARHQQKLFRLPYSSLEE